MNDDSRHRPGQPDDELRLDEDFVRAAAFIEDEPGRRPRPSRESMREVKREARQRQKARARGTTGKPPRRRPRGRHLVLLAVAAVVVAVVVSGGLGVLGLPSSTASRQIPVVVPSSTPTAAVSESPSPSPTQLTDPYAGTEVAGWPVGDSGIVAPVAKATAGFTAAEVAAAYRHTTVYLHEALLDPVVLFRAQLGPVEATIVKASLLSWQRDPPGNKDWPTFLANRFLPQQVAPGRFPFRVNGFMSAGRNKEGQLRVSFHYVAVYDVVGRNSTPGALPILVGIRRDGAMAYDVTGDRTATSAWLEESSYTSDRSDCTRKWPYPGYLEVYLRTADDPSAPATTNPATTASEQPYAMLDPRATTPPTGQCFNDTTDLGPSG